MTPEPAYVDSLPHSPTCAHAARRGAVHVRCASERSLPSPAFASLPLPPLILFTGTVTDCVAWMRISATAKSHTALNRPTDRALKASEQCQSRPQKSPNGSLKMPSGRGSMHAPHRCRDGGAIGAAVAEASFKPSAMAHPHPMSAARAGDGGWRSARRRQQLAHCPFSSGEIVSG